MIHVDDFVSTPGGDRYARFVLMLFRLPAMLQAEFAELTKDYKLFCDYEGKRYRCIGASRLGDVWLTKDLTRDVGYELRVDPAECGNWSKSA